MIALNLGLLLPAGGIAMPVSRLGAFLACSVFLIGCGGSGGGSSSSSAAPASAPSDPAPSLSFSASSATVAAGDSVTLNWQSSNADNCRASGGWSGDKSASGSETLGPLQQSQTYSLSCSGAGGGALRDVAVTVSQSENNDGVSVSLSSDQTSVLVNGQIELSWTSNSADSCESSGDWTGARSLNGTFTTPALTKTATYKLTCFAQGESAIALITVEVTDKTIRWQAPTENVDGTELTDLAGFNVYWGDDEGSYNGSANVDADTREWDIPLGSGTYYLAVTALDAEDNESVYSNEIRRVIP